MILVPSIILKQGKLYLNSNDFIQDTLLEWVISKTNNGFNTIQVNLMDDSFINLNQLKLLLDSQPNIKIKVLTSLLNDNLIDYLYVNRVDLVFLSYNYIPGYYDFDKILRLKDKYIKLGICLEIIKKNKPNFFFTDEFSFFVKKLNEYEITEFLYYESFIELTDYKLKLSSLVNMFYNNFNNTKIFVAGNINRVHDINNIISLANQDSSISGFTVSPDIKSKDFWQQAKIKLKNIKLPY